MAKKLWHGDLREPVRGLMKKKAQLKTETDQIRDHRRSRDAFTLILQRAALDKFGPGPRDSGTQSTFRKVLIHEHRSINPEAEDELWCPVPGGHVEYSVMKAVYIFPYCLGEDVMEAVIERKFDEFMIVIVPAGAPESGRWKPRVLDKSILKEKEMSKDCWATPGEYIRQNMLIALAERIEHSVPEDRLQEHVISEPLIPHLDDKMAAKVVMDAVEEDNSDEARFDPEFS